LSEKIFKRIEEGQSTYEKILKYIPGYRGYKQKEIRRETDRLVRSMVASLVENGRKKLDRVLGAITKERIDERARRVDRLTKELTMLEEKIRHASHGYAGLFDAIKVREGELDNLVKYDASLAELSQKVDETCQSALLAAEQRQFDDLDKALDLVGDYTGRMEEMLSRRDETLLGAGER
jgi:ribosomal protein L20